jgi:NADPH:quinone reductase-like Zn-dependent oxidoreductase
MQIRQVVVTGQNQVELQADELDPARLGPNEVLIKSEWSFISTGTELANYTGREPKVFQPGAWCAYPWKSGYANCGIVQAVGAQVKRTQPGERVFTYGRHASHFAYDANRLLIGVPDDIDPALGGRLWIGFGG